MEPILIVHFLLWLIALMLSGNNKRKVLLMFLTAIGISKLVVLSIMVNLTLNIITYLHRCVIICVCFQSKLTRILKDGLSGNSQTVMIATVTPVDNQYHNIVNTLKYADRAKEIKTHIQVRSYANVSCQNFL